MKDNKIDELNKKYNFTNNERELLKHGIDAYLDHHKLISLDTIDALYKWNSYFNELEKIMINK